MELGAVQIPEELCGLVDFLKTMKLRNVMEIGSEAGGTFWLWCQLAALGGIKISLDKPDGDSGSGRFASVDALIARTKKFKTFAPRVCVLTGDSHRPPLRDAVQQALGEELLDFLFIDGDHSYEGVKKDFDDYRGFVRPGGLIAFHDIVDSEFHRKRGCFVAQLWKEFDDVPILDLPVIEKEFVSNPDWGGIGVVTV